MYTFFCNLFWYVKTFKMCWWCSDVKRLRTADLGCHSIMYFHIILHILYITVGFVLS